MCTEALGYLGSLREASNFILMKRWGTKGTGADLSLNKARGEKNGPVSLKLSTPDLCEAALLWTGDVSASALIDHLALVGFVCF